MPISYHSLDVRARDMKEKRVSSRPLHWGFVILEKIGRRDSQATAISEGNTPKYLPHTSSPPLTPSNTSDVVKLDSRETPPPLHYSPTPSDIERVSPSETTPVGTPKGFGAVYPRKAEKERDLLFSWHRKTNNHFEGPSGLYVDSALLESDLDDSTFPLFGQSPPPDRMLGASSPITIAAQSRGGLASSQHTSNLTSALQSTTGNELRLSPLAYAGIGKGTSSGSGRHDSMTAGASGLTPQYGNGAQPISMTGSNRGQSRRESLAGSMAAGMSWGGVSVGSWLRDDIMMQGTSPFPYRSPSFHSSSYLPKLEANFMRDFTCCGLTMHSLHALLQHYEESHAPQIPLPMQSEFSRQNIAPPDTRAAIASAAASNVQNQARQQSGGASSSSNPSSNDQPFSSGMGGSRSAQQHPHFKTGEFHRTPLQPVQDMDTVEDMEMDDTDFTSIGHLQGQYATLESPQMIARSQFGQPASARVPPLDMNALNFNNPLQGHQGLRQSQPSTPVSGGRPGVMYHNNPTVSSVNTPTLSAHPLQQQQFRNTPDSSSPGTPAELDPDFMGVMDNMSMDNAQMSMHGLPLNYNAYGFGNGNEMLDLCIDEPAKRLFQPNGGLNNQQQAQARLGGNTQYGANSELARRIREQQCRVGLADTVSGLNGEEPKPFRCPVIGCEKAYKNQNGLKYHKTHGHNNQQLHENADGTFSIVDPTTLTPYPGTLGMEKEKPFKCEACGKRYKNLNGLKYHKSHSPPCNPELKLAAGMPINTSGMNANIAGVGLSGMGDEMMP
ncbi:Transcriptional regulator of ribosomal biogenesis proteins [Lambiella insularis]|nr:Transcriptional regulator of ribosomal biogenesis proteins [Lambiella insularis]